MNIRQSANTSLINITNNNVRGTVTFNLSDFNLIYLHAEDKKYALKIGCMQFALKMLKIYNAFWIFQNIDFVAFFWGKSLVYPTFFYWAFFQIRVYCGYSEQAANPYIAIRSITSKKSFSNWRKCFFLKQNNQ